MAFVLGSVPASAAPAAVTALGRRLALPPRVQVLVQAESRFNDATRLVLRVEAAELQRLYEEHDISDTTRRRLQRSLDLEDARLADA
ncbi:hypothetical protein [Streptomyces sp. DSM 40976]|nr:hypothetical protein [Streptomyces sp. DSM 40976]